MSQIDRIFIKLKNISKIQGSNYLNESFIVSENKECEKTNFDMLYKEEIRQEKEIIGGYEDFLKKTDEITETQLTEQNLT